MLIQQITDSKLDIIGDIHGEIAALTQLLGILGYDNDGYHHDDPERKLVFVGDLVDRGINSWAVYKKVRHLVEHQRAYCILGNHELNLLIPDPKFSDGRPKVKPGNEWFHGKVELVYPDDPTAIQPQYLLTQQTEREEIQHFLRTLPIAIEGPGIRIVHACWDPESIEAIRHSNLSVVDIYAQYERQIHAKIALEIQDYLDTHPVEKAEAEQLGVRRWFEHLDRGHKLRVHAEYYEQNDNPIKVITSGPEEILQPPAKPYEAGKKMRYLKRSSWWNLYTDPELVVFGHYWRKADVLRGEMLDFTPEDKKNIPEIFNQNEHYHHLLGNKRCMCIDYSVGKRFIERHHNCATGQTGSFLGALRCTKEAANWNTKLILDDHRDIIIKA